LQGIAREQQHNTTRTVAIKDVSKSAQKLAGMANEIEYAVEAARFLRPLRG
jgi:hypothetical protein